MKNIRIFNAKEFEKDLHDCEGFGFLMPKDLKKLTYID
jgi:hypothetical protein